MKINLKTLTVGLCLLLTLASVGTLCSLAQNADDSNNKLSDKKILKTIRTRRGDAPFVILTPEDFAGFSKERIAALGDPCDSAQFINYGQTINGQLTSADCRPPDNSYADFYIFNGNQGDQVTINMSSTAFDTYLGLANESGTFQIEDDNGGGGTNSRIIATLPSTAGFTAKQYGLSEDRPAQNSFIR